MNKNNSIYATEVHEEEPRTHLKTTFEAFRNRLQASISQNIAFKKKNVARQSAECLEQLMKIKEQSSSHKKRVEQQQKEFQERVEKHIRQDISKWSDFQAFFKEGFDQLEHNLQLHREKNKEYKRRISMKQIQLKAIMQQEKESHVRVSSLVKKAEERSSITTKESSIIGRTQSLRTRMKTDASLPVLKPSRYDRIKTIQSDYEEQLARPKRVMSYMEPIGTLRTRQESSLTLLMELLQWHKKNSAETTEDNWFLKVLYTSRHFSKLMAFLSANCASRKVQTKL